MKFIKALDRDKPVFINVNYIESISFGNVGTYYREYRYILRMVSGEAFYIGNSLYIEDKKEIE